VSAPTIDELRRVDVFSELTGDQLAWLAAHGTVETYESGDAIFAPGSEADTMVAVLEGTIEIVTSVGGQLVPFFTTRQGAVSGLLPFSRMRTYAGAGYASGRTRLFRLHQRHFDEMLHVAPELGPKLVGLMSDRVRESTRLAQQRDKMMALGKLAAGLAHELNNPAAAVRSGADRLQERLARLPVLTARLAAHPAAAEACAALDDVLPKGPLDDLSARERAAREDVLAQWLESRGIEESWVVAETLVAAGAAPEALDRATGPLPPAAVGDYVSWLEAVVGSRQLTTDIRNASARISELIGSIKVYSHMDRAASKEPIDVREGLDSTLVMLGHKLKRANVTLERLYADALPRIEAFPGELNQVWTNLIDNAVDAMPDGGTLRIEAEPDGSTLVVRVIDSGGGIPDTVQPHIFDAFFTTKPVGQGTGLGLDIVQRIVAQQHGGRIDVESQPGRTVFIVRLPIAARP
jgi:signal transduction histidine kinase